MNTEIFGAAIYFIWCSFLCQRDRKNIPRWNISSFTTASLFYVSFLFIYFSTFVNDYEPQVMSVYLINFFLYCRAFQQASIVHLFEFFFCWKGALSCVSGKTATMVGSPDSTNSLGVIPCAIAWLFRGIQEQKQKTGARFSVRVSAVEVFQPTQTMKDLLLGQATGEWIGYPISKENYSQVSNSLIK